MNASTVVVLGANGRFGQAAVTAFAAAGWSVLAQVRRAPPRPLPPGVRVLHGPLSDVDGLAVAAAGARAVVHAVNPPYTAWARDLLPLARQGMDLAQRLGATFVLPGNVYAFGAAMPPRLTETTPPRPDTRKGRLRAELEAELAARAAGGLRSVVVRAGDFFGGGRGSWFDLVIVEALARGRIVYPGPIDLPHAWAYLPDLARCVVAVAARDDLPPAARLHFEGHTLTGRQLLDAVDRAAATLGLRPPDGLRRGRVPWPLWRALGVFVPMLREVVEMAYLWQVPHALDGTRLSALVGDPRTTPIDEALVAALVDLGFGAGAPAQAARPGIVAPDAARDLTA